MILKRLSVVIRAINFRRRVLLSHSVTRNAAALWVMQAVSYIAPLTILPYLTRTLGTEGFGMFVALLAFINFAQVITDYGFSLSATYQISLARDDHDYIKMKITSIYTAKIILLFNLGMLIFVLLQINPKLVNELFEPLLILWIIVIQSLMPTWYFRGIERMQKITFYTVLSRIVYFALIFILVRNPEDIRWIFISLATAETIALVVALRLMWMEGGRIKFPRWADGVKELVDGRGFFISRLATSMYSTIGLVLLGVGSSVEAARYAVCETVYRASLSATSPITNALYPFMAKSKDTKIFMKVVVWVGALVAIVVSIMAIYSQEILTITFGQEYVVANEVLLIFLLMSVVSYFGVSFGYSAFAALGRVDIANKSVIIASIMYILMIGYLYLTSRMTSLHFAIALLVTELVVLAVRVSIFFWLRIRYAKGV